MNPAAVLSVLVTARTGAANAALMKTSAQFRGTATAARASSAGVRSAALGIAGGAALIAGAAVKMATGFEDAMVQIETQAGAPKGEIKKLRGEVLELSKATEFGPTELAEGLFRVESAGYRGAKAMSVLREAANLADVGHAELEATTGALTAAMRSGIKGAQDEAKAVGILNATVGAGSMRMEDLVGALSTGILPSAKAVGLELTDVSTALAMMTRTGVPANSAATRLRMTLSLMAAPTDAAQDALKEIGLEEDSLAKAMRGPDGLVGAVELLKEHLSDLSKVEQAQVISKMFGGGRTSSAIIAMVQDTETLGKIQAQIKQKSSEFGAAVAKDNATAASKFRSAWAKAQGILVSLGAKLSGPASDAALFFVGAIETVIKVLGAVPGEAYLVMAAMAATGLAIKGVAMLAGSAFVASIGSVIATLRILGMTFMATAAASGVMSGAWAVMSLAFATNPIGAAVVAVGALTAGFFLLKDSIFGLFSGEDELSKRQQRLKDTSVALKGALKNQASAMGAVKESSKAVRNAHDDERKATDRVHRAESRLKEVRQKYPANARPVLEAEADLVRAKNKERRATKRLEEMEREHGIVKKSLKPVLREALFAERDRIHALKDERKRLIGVLKGQLDMGASSAELKETQDKLTKVSKQTTRAHANQARTLQEAAERVGPKFAKSIKHMNTEQLDFGRLAKSAGGAVSQRLLPTLEKGTGKIKKFGGETKTTTGNMKDFKTTGVQSVTAVGGSANALFGDLSVPKVSTGVKNPNRKAFGGFAVPGKGFGDKVPVNLLTEPGEKVFVLNQHASRTADALSALNSQYPRSAMKTGGWVDPAGPGTGVVNPAIASQVGQWSKRYQAAINYGYDPGGGHVSPGHNVTGTATDTGPAAGWTTAGTRLFEQGLRALEGKVDQIIYGTAGIGMSLSNHGRGDHAHIEWGMSPGGIAMAKMKKIIITGPQTLPTQANQAIADKAVAAVNKKLKKAATFAGTEAGGSAGMFSAGQMANLWGGVNPGLGSPTIAGAVGMAESAGNPKAFGPPDGRGLWQVEWGMHPEVHHFGNPYIPEANAKMAGSIYRAAGGWSPWVAYNTGRHLQFMKKGGLAAGLPEYAGGVDFHPGGLAMLGEQGRELAQLPRGTKVHSNTQTEKLVGSGPTKIEFHVHGPGMDAVIDKVYAVVDGERVEVEGFDRQRKRMGRP